MPLFKVNPFHKITKYFIMGMQWQILMWGMQLICLIALAKFCEKMTKILSLINYFWFKVTARQTVNSTPKVRWGRGWQLSSHFTDSKQKSLRESIRNLTVPRGEFIRPKTHTWAEAGGFPYHSTFFQVMASCCLATSHFPISNITRLQWVKYKRV